METPELLYSDVVEVDERVILAQTGCEINKQCKTVISPFTKEKVGELCYFCLLAEM